MNKASIDFAIAWDWEYDKEFVDLLEVSSKKKKLSTFLVHSYNIKEISTLIKQKKIHFHTFLDRASDTNSKFNICTQQIETNKTINLNPKPNALLAEDKSILHFLLLKNKINTPKTIILNSHQEEPHIDLQHIVNLPTPFVVKPARGGGGEGVWKYVTNTNDIHRIRHEFRGEKYLIQEKITPKIISEKRAWIRAYFVFGHIFFCWWDDTTHIYTAVTISEQKKYPFFKKIKNITKKIANIVELNFFSTEIVVLEDDTIVCVDYVNDPCDMRLKSIHHTGVPDNLVEEIADTITSTIERTLKQQKLLKTQKRR